MAPATGIWPNCHFAGRHAQRLRGTRRVSISWRGASYDGSPLASPLRNPCADLADRSIRRNGNDWLPSRRVRPVSWIQCRGWRSCRGQSACDAMQRLRPPSFSWRCGERPASAFVQRLLLGPDFCDRDHGRLTAVLRQLRHQTARPVCRTTAGYNAMPVDGSDNPAWPRMAAAPMS